MRTCGLLHLMFVCLLLCSCQVKKNEPTSGLISEHQQVTNKFTLLPQANTLFGLGEVLTLEFSFPFDMVINTGGGFPRLNITIGSTTRYADYVAGANPRRIAFRYTMQTNEVDSDGILVNAMELNGSTLTFTYQGTTINCNEASLAGLLVTNLTVDTINFLLPEDEIQIEIENENHHFIVDDQDHNLVLIYLSFNFIEVSVDASTGMPYVMVHLGDRVVPFYYEEVLSSSTQMVFKYTLPPSSYEPTEALSIASPIHSNGSEIIYR